MCLLKFAALFSLDSAAGLSEEHAMSPMWDDSKSLLGRMKHMPCSFPRLHLAILYVRKCSLSLWHRGFHLQNPG